MSSAYKNVTVHQVWIFMPKTNTLAYANDLYGKTFFLYFLTNIVYFVAKFQTW